MRLRLRLLYAKWLMAFIGVCVATALVGWLASDLGKRDAKEDVVIEAPPNSDQGQQQPLYDYNPPKE